jgi:hypothetical protein
MSRQKGKPAWEQPRWVAFAILALLVLVSTAASAQTTMTKTNETFDWSGDVMNPCNGDTAHVVGKQHFMVSQQDQKNGRVHIQMNETQHGQGPGSLFFGTPPQQLQYTYRQSNRINWIIPAPPAGQPTLINRFRIKMTSSGANSTGFPDNFHATFATTIHRNGNVAPSKAESDCRGKGKESF